MDEESVEAKEAVLSSSQRVVNIDTDNGYLGAENP